MDENSFNIHNNLFGYSGSPNFSINSTSKKNLLNENDTKKVNQIDSLVDLDQSDSDETSLKNRSMNNIENSKLEYRRKLIANLNNKRNQTNDIERSTEKKSQSSNRSVSIKRGIQHVDNEHNNLHISNSKTNYRTICDIESKPSRSSLSSVNKLDNGGFLSLSRQSLNESLNESGITNTASRISANILKQNLSQKSETSQKLIPNSSIAPRYPSRTLRYRTLTKKDNFSSYLTRVTNDIDLFGPPSNNPVSLNLNLSESSTCKRVDFSKIIKTPNSKQIEIDTIANQTWNCTNCEASNPSSFNFCPICSASNPKLTLSRKMNLKRMHDFSKSDWTCQRCSTKNEDMRTSCIFCFKNKADSLETEKPYIKKRKIIEDSNETVQEIEAYKFSGNEKDVQFAFGDISSSSIYKFGSNITSSSKDNNEINKEKWNCPTCLVDNAADKESCVCCMTKNPNAKSSKDQNKASLFNSGNNSSLNTSIKFGSNIDSFSKTDGKPFVFGNNSSQDSSIKFDSKVGTNDSENTSKWNCPTCLVDNAADKESCVCCMTKNPNAKSSKDQNKAPLFNSGNNSSKNTSIKFESNIDSFSKTDEKPFVFGNNSSQDSSIKFGSNIDSFSKTDEKPFVFGNNSSQDSSNKFGTKNSENTSKWNCPTCLVDNVADQESCVCCMTKNPNVKSLKINNDKPQFSFGNSSVQSTSIRFGADTESLSKTISNGISSDKKSNSSSKNSNLPNCNSLFKFGNNSSPSPIKFGADPNLSSKVTSNKTIESNKEKWNCPTCLVDNTADKDSCPCCLTKNPNIKSIKANNENLQFKFGNYSNQSPIIKFGSTINSSLKTNACANDSNEKWNCALCLVENDDSADSCVCCQTSRSSTKNESTALSIKPIATSPVNGMDPIITTSISNSTSKSLFQLSTSVAPSAGNGVHTADSNDLEFLFSPATSLGISSTTQVPIELDFEFESPLLL